MPRWFSDECCSRSRTLLGAAGVVFIVATFAYFLPKVADYRDVWQVVKGMSWEWLVALWQLPRSTF